MYLKQIELKGFKSFGPATRIELPPGFIAVVGPNGSGKSNVLEAVAFALGIQGPSLVRSSRMEDVIFAGSARHAALGRAEVTIVLDNSDGASPSLPAEVAIRRVVWRGGEGEYYLNNAPVRLHDLQEIVADMGLGRSRHIYVGQGQVDAVLSMSDLEKRMLIEEAAGIVKFRRRKEEAARRLEECREEMAKLRAVIRELERRLGPLKEQSITLAKRRELSERREALVVEIKRRQAADLVNRASELEQRLRDLSETARRREEQVAQLKNELAALLERASSEELEALEALVGTYGLLEERASGLFRICAERLRAQSGTAARGESVKELREREQQLLQELKNIEGELESLAAQQGEIKSLEERESGLGALLQNLLELESPFSLTARAQERGEGFQLIASSFSQAVAEGKEAPIIGALAALSRNLPIVVVEPDSLRAGALKEALDRGPLILRAKGNQPTFGEAPALAEGVLSGGFVKVVEDFEAALSLYLSDPRICAVSRDGYLFSPFLCAGPNLLGAAAQAASRNSSLLKEVSELKEELERTRKQKEELRLSLTSRKARAEEKRRVLSSELKQLSALISRMTQEQQGAYALDERGLVALRGMLKICQQVRERASLVLSHLKRMREAAAAARREAAIRASEVRAALEEAEAHLRETRDQKARLELELAEKSASLASLEELLKSEGYPSVEELLSRPPLDAPDDKPLESQLEEVEAQIRALGPVNELAAEQAESLEEQRSFLTEQLKDSESSFKQLKSLIAELEAEIEQSFARAFSLVNSEFSRTFGTLFPGGAARLRLSGEEPQGVILEANPAGKALKRLALLSGGERSLVALAFLFALFRLRPSPFYLLDEVEAALDDSNVERLMALFQEMKQGSQLIVATHQRRTIEAADAVVGVTMGGDGVSQIVTARLKDF